MKGTIQRTIKPLSRFAGALILGMLVLGCHTNVSAKDTTAPAEVTELKAVAENGKINLGWKNPGDADLYQVEITASPAAGTLANSVYLSAEKGKAMSFTVEGLTNGTAYTFTVKTLDKALNKSTGVSTAEAVKPIDTSDKTPPAEVGNLQAEALAGAIRVTWTDPADEDLWGIEITSQQEIVTRSIAPIPENAIFVAKGQQSRKISNLTVGQSYTFTVKAIDNAGNKSAGIKTTAVTPVAGEPMSVTLTQNPATPTNGDVTVSITSSTLIKEAKWKEGSGYSAKDVFESGTAITGNGFTVTANGIYSVVVQDNDGRREVEMINIENIDKTPPPAPKNFTTHYTLSAKKIVLNWTDPIDIGSGLKELKLSYTVNGINEKTETIAKDVQTFEIVNVEPQSSPELYAFSLKAVDNTGNEGAEAVTTEKPSEQTRVTGISLSRTHLDTKMTDRTIEVTIIGSNFDKLTSLMVQVVDEQGYDQTWVTPTIDAPNNKATAIVNAPQLIDTTDEGTVYTVKAMVNSITTAEATASFIVSNPARVTKVELTPAQLKFGSVTKVNAAVTGTNFDIRGETKIKLLDSNEAEVTASTKIVPAGEVTATGFTAELPLPSESGVYTVAVYFDNVKQEKTGTVQLYDIPEITSVSIPKAGKTYGGKKLPITVTGKNFTAPGISADKFTGTPGLTDITIVSDTVVTATVVCPIAEGETDLTVICTPEQGSPVQGRGKIIVKDYAGCTVGKIVLKNGDWFGKDFYSSIDESNPPVGIICGINSYDAPRMIALHTSKLSWATYNSTGYNTKFEGIICRNEADQPPIFTGDTDGSDNWEYICRIDPDGTANAAENYPAFHWVNEYGKTYRTGEQKWYMPSIKELYEVHKNKDTINESLKKICDMPRGSTYADRSLGTDIYCSSSQSPYDNTHAWQDHFYNGNVFSLNKNYDYRVCCLAGF